MSDAMSPCPKCGEDCYSGGYCFKCGTYRPASKKRRSPRQDGDSEMEIDDSHVGQRITAGFRMINQDDRGEP